jgi:hypothetical protein
MLVEAILNLLSSLPKGDELNSTHFGVLSGR